MRLWPRSLIGRILVVELAAIVVVAILLPTIMVSFMHQEVDRFERQTITSQASRIAASISHRSGSYVLRLPSDLTNVYATPYDGRAFVIADANSRVVWASAYAELVPWRTAPRDQSTHAFRTGDFIGVSLPVSVGGRPFWVVVTRNETGPGAVIDDTANAFLWRYSPVLLLILLLLPLINSLLIGRLVMAVQAVSKQAGAISPNDLRVRLNDAGLPLEIAPLAHATNALLGRLQQSFQQQSEFVANVAHELRTPLATLRVELDRVDEAELRNRLIASTDRLTHVVAQLQDLASLETVSRDRFEQFDACELAREVVSELAHLVFANGDEIGLETPDAPVMVRGNRTLAALALSNLIVNATRHTPSGTTVSVDVSPNGAIQVADNGPGIASLDPDRARQRFWRADRRRSDSAGLGLSIVERIMEVHDGRFRVESWPGKGARLTLEFPLADAGSAAATDG